MAAPYPTLRAFIAEMISGDHAIEDVNRLLDQMAMGEGLDDQEIAMAARLEALGIEDRDPHNGAPPDYRRGYSDGYMAGHRAGRSGVMRPPRVKERA